MPGEGNLGRFVKVGLCEKFAESTCLYESVKIRAFERWLFEYKGADFGRKWEVHDKD